MIYHIKIDIFITSHIVYRITSIINNMNSFNQWWASWSLIPESYLRSIVSRQEIGQVGQDVFISWQNHPLTLGFSISSFDTETTQKDAREWVMHLIDIPYCLDNASWKANIEFPLISEKRKPWSIELQEPKKRSFHLQFETHRQIENVFRYSQRLQWTESIRVMSKIISPIAKDQKTLRYSDKDGNVFFLYSPKINKWLKVNQPDIHTAIRSLRRERDNTMVQYQIIGSYQEGKWREQSITLIGMEMGVINQYNFDRLSINEQVRENELTSLSQHTEIFKLSAEILRSVIEGGE